MRWVASGMLVLALGSATGADRERPGTDPDLEVLAPQAMSAPAFVYVCPIHPEIRSNDAGRCRRCGTALAPAIPDPLEYRVETVVFNATDRQDQQGFGLIGIHRADRRGWRVYLDGHVQECERAVDRESRS